MIVSDVQSSLAITIGKANPRACEALVVEGGTPALARELLDGVTPDQLLAAPAQSPVAAYAMLAGLWLWHDGLRECHEIVQKSPEDLLGAALYLHSKASKMSPNVPSVQFMEPDKVRNTQHLRDMAFTVAYWHAIMHRREGDFSNSKYWLARCRSHPSSAAIAQSLPKLIEAHSTDPATAAVAGGGWNPPAFVDLVEQIHNRPNDPRRETVIAIQRLEWRILFAHCAAGIAEGLRRTSPA